MEYQVMVSVYCLTYNHEKYIRDALEGFVSQKTDFAYEVLVHDDASTDSTAKIIREYAEKYPGIIKPILQTENQYSKNVKIVKTIITPLLRGKYIAICEGDDAWIDPNKLQKQFDFMELHPECSLCVHQAYKKNMTTGEQSLFNNEKKSRYYSTEEIICGGGGLFSTNSMFIRADVFKNKPLYDMRVGTGDYQNMIHFALSGRCYFFSEPMSFYRLGVQGSWTQRCYSTTTKKVAAQQLAIEMLEKADRYYNNQYHSIFKKAIRIKQYRIAKMESKHRILFRIKYWDLAKHELLRDIRKALKNLRTKKA